MSIKNADGIRNLCKVAVHIRETMEVNPATKFAIRTVLREAINKSNEKYKGNNNRKNCRYISLEAERLLKTDPAASVVADHALPVSMALKEFEGLQDRSIDNVVDLMKKYSLMVLITPDEDQQLRKAKLAKAMPKGWDGNDPLARYKAAKIQLNVFHRQ